MSIGLTCHTIRVNVLTNNLGIGGTVNLFSCKQCPRADHNNQQTCLAGHKHRLPLTPSPILTPRSMWSPRENVVTFKMNELLNFHLQYIDGLTVVQIQIW